ncbi:hypothetical protein ACFL3G_12650 [Planctomycetota bacterium]
MLKATQNSKLKTQNYKGSAILMVLVSVVIVFLLYFIMLTGVFNPNMPSMSSAPDSRPWLEEDRIVEANGKIKLPKSPKPTLGDGLTFNMTATRKENDRGPITIQFDQTGRISGEWSCEYSHEEREYSFDAEFAGNIDVKKKYEDEDGRDKSKLYFITKGEYTHTIYNNTTKREIIEQGIIYVTGWLNRDHSLFGLITITTDKSRSTTYNFSTQQ